jgi:hypothetical protein
MTRTRVKRGASPQSRTASRHKSMPHFPGKKIGADWAGHVPMVKPGRYADGLPFHDLTYLSFKLPLLPNRLDSRKSLFKFGKQIVSPCAAENDIDFSMDGFKAERIQIREVLFIDTPDLRLYRNAFILRRRIRYKDGFPTGDPEIVFKFRHTDIQKAAATDVRPQIRGSHRVKFKCQAMPLRDQLGGVRMLYSHNVQFPRPNVAEEGVLAEHGRDENSLLTMGAMAHFFPVLTSLRSDPKETIKLVGGMVVEEVLQDIGAIDFGEGVRADCDVALWRARGEHRPLIGEFSYQIKFGDRRELPIGAMRKAEAFFKALQFASVDWIALGATKTGVVYRQDGRETQAHA